MVDIDQELFKDLKTHLNNCDDYLVERKRFYSDIWKKKSESLYPEYWFLRDMPLYAKNDVFVTIYIKQFLSDMKVLKDDMTEVEAVSYIHEKWRGYYNVFGEEFIRRIYNCDLDYYLMRFW